MMNEAYLKAIIARVETGKNELTDFPEDVRGKIDVVDGKLSIMQQPIIAVEPSPTLDDRVTAVEGVTEEMITILNDKGIAP